jgi:hypothetical protein
MDIMSVFVISILNDRMVPMLPHAIHSGTRERNARKRPRTTALAVSHHTLVPLALAEHIAVLLERASRQLGLLPQVGGEETV